MANRVRQLHGAIREITAAEIAPFIEGGNTFSKLYKVLVQLVTNFFQVGTLRGICSVGDAWKDGLAAICGSGFFRYS